MTKKPPTTYAKNNAKNIVLIGMMGSGKSSIGCRLATRLDLPFKDSDTEIENAAGMEVAEIFTQHGEDSFRDGERRVILRLLEKQNTVLALGGGAFMNEEIFAAIKQKAVSVWLDVDLKELVRRVGKRPNKRPLLKEGNPEDILRTLMATRAPIYAQADIVVKSKSESHKATAQAIIAALCEKNILSKI